MPNPAERQPDLDDITAESRGRAMRFSRLYTLPYWFIFLVIVGVLLAISIVTDEIYARIFDQLKAGILMTLFVSAASYSLALLLAIAVGIIRSNPPAAPQTRETVWKTLARAFRILMYNLCTIYVSVMRGIPVLIVLLVTAFIIVPALRGLINDTVVVGLRGLSNDPDVPDLIWRGSSAPSAIMALAITYGA